ncbi:MAG TPA: hypothetical protein VGG41_08130 [Solirubrobacteraceae bacterium]
MLIVLVVFAALTALVAGVAGAWSPCGFSMVDTIGTALGDARRGTTVLATATFTIGALAGGAATFGGLAAIGSLLGATAGLRDAIACALALVAALADWRGVRIAPQIRRQVPERWRWIMPLPLACGLYGLLLGLGFTTFVLSFAVWALAGISFADGSLALGIVVGLAFGLGRALPVVWISPHLGSERGQRALDRLALEPRLWLGLRRLDAIGLGACAAVLAGSTGALAATTLPSLATDPSVDGATLAWQQAGGHGWILEHARSPRQLPGRLPALGGGHIAWVKGHHLVVADRFPAPAPVRIPAPRGAVVDALAVSRHWLIVRDASSDGIANLFALSLRSPARRVYLEGSSTPGAIGRPAISGSTVVFAFSDSRRSTLDEVDLASGKRRVLRQANANVLYSNPAIASGSLLYERTSRCKQQLLLAPSPSAAHDRVLLTLPSTVTRDPGYQSGYVQDYNSASLCANRKTGPGGTITLGPSALAARVAYVSESPSDPASTRIITLSLG